MSPAICKCKEAFKNKSRSISVQCASINANLMMKINT